MITFIGCMCSAAVFWLLFRSELKENTAVAETVKPKPETQINYSKLCDNIDSLNSLKSQLASVENMIINIECCSSNDLTSINISDSQYSCSVLVNSKSDLLKTLYMQRSLLRSSIAEKLQEII